jgi:hypothetical protein
MGRRAKASKIEGHGSGLHVVYPDGRLEPRSCVRTNIIREFCPCAPCRRLRRKKHRAACTCWLCFSDRMGAFIDQLGQKTSAGRWLWFVTLTFRTSSFPWRRGFPMQEPQPSPDFVRHCFEWMIRWLEGQVHGRVEYFVVHQFGDTGGRLHLHCGLSWPGLFEYRWKDLQNKLWERAGFNRILPWKEDAGYYIGRYIGRDTGRSDWDFRAGKERRPEGRPVGRQIVAHSPSPVNSSAGYRQTSGRWHR